MDPNFAFDRFASDDSETRCRCGCNARIDGSVSIVENIDGYPVRLECAKGVDGWLCERGECLNVREVGDICADCDAADRERQEAAALAIRARDDEFASMARSLTPSALHLLTTVAADAAAVAAERAAVPGLCRIAGVRIIYSNDRHNAAVLFGHQLVAIDGTKITITPLGVEFVAWVAANRAGLNALIARAS